MHIWDIAQDNISGVVGSFSNIAANHNYHIHGDSNSAVKHSFADDVVVYVPDSSSSHENPGLTLPENTQSHIAEFKNGSFDASTGRLEDSGSWTDEYMDGWLYTERITLHADALTLGTATVCTKISHCNLVSTNHCGQTDRAKSLILTEDTLMLHFVTGSRADKAARDEGQPRVSALDWPGG